VLNIAFYTFTGNPSLNISKKSRLAIAISL
jgi:hypothetical protein